VNTDYSKIMTKTAPSLMLTLFVLLGAQTTATVAMAETSRQPSSQSSTEGKWTVGLVGTTTYEQTWEPMVLPWLSYQTLNYSINPLGALLIGERKALHWQVGLGLDYSELFSETERGFLSKASGQYFWGPLRITGSASARLIDPLKSWQWNTAVGSQMPVGPGMLGVEIGLNGESKRWGNNVSQNGVDEVTSEVGIQPIAGLQYGFEFGDWQTMLIAQYQGTDSENTPKQTYTWLVMKAW